MQVIAKAAEAGIKLELKSFFTMINVLNKWH
ncbi:hypothetical protein ACFTAO_15400 [Paenibacillus rhizoplanae]